MTVFEVSPCTIEWVVDGLFWDVVVGSVRAKLLVTLDTTAVFVESDPVFKVVECSNMIVVSEILFGLVACSNMEFLWEAVCASLIKEVLEVPRDPSVSMLNEVVSALILFVLWEVPGSTDVSVKIKPLVIVVDS